jgi:hypothetical protein
MHEIENFFANFQIFGPLGCQGRVVIPQNVKKSQNHCTLLPMLLDILDAKNMSAQQILDSANFHA